MAYETDSDVLFRRRTITPRSVDPVITFATTALVVMVTVGIGVGIGVGYSSLRDQLVRLEQKNAAQAATIADLWVRASR